MAVTHTVTISDGSADLTLSWSPDGTMVVAEGDDKAVRFEIGRDEVFSLSQWAGTVLNQLHFGDDPPGGDDD